MRTFVMLLLFVAGLLVLRASLFTVDATEYAYVTLLGRPVAIYDGANPDEAGLHINFPWPIVSVQRIDRRVQEFDLPTTELLTRDPQQKTIDKNLSVEAYVVWRIPTKEDADRFVRRIGTPERAMDILGPRINSQLGAEIGKMRMDDLVTTASVDGEPRVDKTMSSLRDKLMSDLAKNVEEEYGIRLEDIRLRRFSHASEVRIEIFRRIRAERQKTAGDYRTDGEKEAKKIETEAEEKAQSILADARLEAARIRSKADTTALALRNQAQTLDPEYYAFLKKMEKLQGILSDSRTMLLLSTHRPMFDLLFHPPQLDKKQAVTKEKKP
jgi:membrane protease subunit HflC